MAQFPASGALFVNARKTSATQPDYTGNLELEHDGQEGGGYQPQASQAPSGYSKPTADAVGSAAKSIDDEIPF